MSLDTQSKIFELVYFYREETQNSSLIKCLKCHNIVNKNIYQGSNKSF